MIRQDIREDLKTHLLNQTQAEDRVHVGRREPLSEDADYPVILIYSGSESAERRTNVPFSLRSYSVVIDVRIRTIENDEGSVDDELDAVAEEIQARLKTFNSPNVKDVVYQGCDPEVNDEGEELYGSLKINFEFKYIR